MAKRSACFFERPNQARVRASLGDADGVADTWNPLSELMSREPDPDARGKDKLRKDMLELAVLVRSAGSLHEAARCLQDHVDDIKWKTRGEALNTLLRYIWNDGAVPNPWEAMKRVLAATRAAAAKLIKGISGTETAVLLGETRAAEQARRKNVVEALLIRWGVKGFLGTGGTKSVSTRAKLSKAHMGNNSRRKGERRKAAAKKHLVRSTREERTEANTNNEEQRT